MSTALYFILGAAAGIGALVTISRLGVRLPFLEELSGSVGAPGAIEVRGAPARPASDWDDDDDDDDDVPPASRGVRAAPAPATSAAPAPAPTPATAATAGASAATSVTVSETADVSARLARLPGGLGRPVVMTFSGPDRLAVATDRGEVVLLDLSKIR